jgi:hypothetical protein
MVTGAVRDFAIVLPIADAMLAANLAATVAGLKNLVVGGDGRPDHIIKQTVVIEIALERCEICKILLMSSLNKCLALLVR